jgi:homoserine/homoserine lactone efflux protein
MDTTLFITFLLVSFGIVVVPGPNVLVIVSTSIAHGKRRGLQTVAGTSLAMAIQLFVAAVTTSSFTRSMAQGFVILKWAGVAYLAYLGLAHIKKALAETTTGISAPISFSRGFGVSITNPKTIVFFGAFLPQFVSASGGYLPQITILSVTFLLLALLLDSCYAILGSRLYSLIKNQGTSRLHWINGLLYWGAGAWLAATRRVQ